MKFLADENISNSIKKIITDGGYDLLDVQKSEFVGSSDGELWKLAKKEGRVIISFDLDFANIIQYPPGEGNGVIVLRPKGMTFEEIERKIGSFISNIEKIRIDKSLVVISKASIRVRR